MPAVSNSAARFCRLSPRDGTLVRVDPWRHPPRALGSRKVLGGGICRDEGASLAGLAESYRPIPMTFFESCCFVRFKRSDREPPLDSVLNELFFIEASSR